MGALHHADADAVSVRRRFRAGRLYKMSLDGKIVGMLGISGHEMGQFNWPHGLACPNENTVYVADMNNWRVQKILIKGAATATR